MTLSKKINERLAVLLALADSVAGDIDDANDANGYNVNHDAFYTSAFDDLIDAISAIRKAQAAIAATLTQ